MKRLLLILSISGSLGLCLATAWGLEKYFLGRDLINFEAGGGDVMQRGEDLHWGEADGLANHYPFLLVADTLRAYRANSGDTGVLLVECLNSVGAAVKDSVTLSTSNVTFSGPCQRVLAVNMAEYHSSASNTGSIRVYTASLDSSHILANIAPQQNRALMAQYTVPRGNILLPRSLRLAWALDSSADKYTRVGGAAALKYREPGQNWRILDLITFRPEHGAMVVEYPADPQYEFAVRPLSQLAVAMALTGAATGGNLDATARFQFDLK